MSGDDDRVAELESVVEDLRETVARQRARIDELESQVGDRPGDGEAEVDRADGTGPAGPVETDDTGLTRRSALKAGGLLGLVGFGSGVTAGAAGSSDGSARNRGTALGEGQVGTPSRPVNVVYTERIGGPLAGNSVVQRLAGDGLRVRNGSLTAAPARPDVADGSGSVAQDVPQLVFGDGLSVTTTADGGVLVTVGSGGGSLSATVSADVAAPTVGQDVRFSVDVSNASGGVQSYAWSVDGSSAGSGSTLTRSFSTAGDYQVSVTVTDGTGATASDSVTVTVTDGSGASVARIVEFVPAPSQLYDTAGLSEHMYVTRVDPGAVDGSSELETFTRDDWKESGAGPLAKVEGLDLTRFATTLAVGDASGGSFGNRPLGVATGDYDEATLVGELEAAGFSQNGTYRDFDVYEGESSGSYYSTTDISVGVGPGFVVSASDVDSYSTVESDSTALLQVGIDAGTGNTDRYVDVNADFPLVMREMAGADIQDCNTQDPNQYGTPSFGTFDNAVARGTTYDAVGQSRADFTEIIVFESESDVDTSDIQTYIEDDLQEAFVDYSGLESSQDGRTVFVTGTIATDDI